MAGVEREADALARDKAAREKAAEAAKRLAEEEAKFEAASSARSDLGKLTLDYAAGLENRKDFPESKPAQWLKEEQAVALKEFVLAGNGFYSLHNNSHVSLSCGM